jgi:aminoglycoside phosphotransferase (APT) family kinase protein
MAEAAASSVSLEGCLPAELRASEAIVTGIAAGLSGAGVYRVECGGQAYVLKLGNPGEPVERFRRKLSVLERAVEAGLAPRVVHVHEARRAILSEFVIDRSFGALFWDPRTREAALGLLGQTLRRLHELPPPPEVEAADARGISRELWMGMAASGFALPTFVGQAVQRVLAEPAPASGALVLSHNDVNPTNVVFDGERLLLLDWETASLNDRYYDLAAISVFLRMDEPTCLRLLAAYDGAASATTEPAAPELPAGFKYNQRVASALCGSMFLHLARLGGHAGATGEEALETTPDLGVVYQRVRSGALGLATPEGQWAFGLALLQASARL